MVALLLKPIQVYLQRRFQPKTWLLPRLVASPRQVVKDGRLSVGTMDGRRSMVYLGSPGLGLRHGQCRLH